MSGITALQNEEAEYTHFLFSADLDLAADAELGAGLLGSYTFGGDNLSASRNLVDGGAAATMLGAPTHHEYWTEFGVGKYLDTQIVEQSDFTYMVVAKKSSVAAFLMGTIQGNLTTPMAALYIWTGLKFQGRTTVNASGGGYTSATATQSNQLASADDWVCVAYSGEFNDLGASQILELRIPKTGEYKVADSYLGTRAKSTLPVTVGGAAAPVSQLQNDIGIAAASFWNRRLPAAQIQRAYTLHHVHYKARGIPI